MLPLPEQEAIVIDANHRPHAFGLGLEERMLQKAPDEVRGIVSPHVKPDQAIGWMTQGSLVEIPVQGEERNPAKPMQKRKDIRVFDSKPRAVVADSSHRNPPRPELWQLIFGEVLVQQVQATASSERPG